MRVKNVEPNRLFLIKVVFKWEYGDYRSRDSIPSFGEKIAGNNSRCCMLALLTCLIVIWRFDIVSYKYQLSIFIKYIKIIYKRGTSSLSTS